MIKGIIYDLDDLLVNSDYLHIQAFEAVLKEYGCSFDKLPSGMKESFVGRRISDIAKEVISYFNLNVDFDYFYKRRMVIFLKIAEKNLEMMPGAMHSLSLFRNRFKLAIASSGAMEYINLVISKFKLGRCFDVIVSGDDVTKGKPDPETYIVAARKLGLKPSECAVLEDAHAGIESAKKAGCKCIAIRNPNTPPQDMSKADIILDSLEKISVEMINKL